MNIDWSKAPEGYDYHLNWGDISKYIKSGFYKKHGDRYVRESGSWTDEDSINNDNNPGLVLTRRPSAWGEYTAGETAPANPAEWTGEYGSLPPVGTVCELYIDDDEVWIKGTVVAHAVLDGLEHAIAHDDKSCFHGIAADFRPIRTAEQIAAEEREAKAKAMYLSIYFAEPPEAWEQGPDTRRETFRKAVDAGWQQVQP